MADPWDVLREKGFPHALDSVRHARHFVVGVVEPRYDHRTAADAAIVVTELAANAFQHAGSGFGVEVGCSAEGIQISVQDCGSMAASAPVIRPGHGLDIVTQIADSWGAAPLPDGKTVWARLPVASNGGSRR